MRHARTPAALLATLLAVAAAGCARLPGPAAPREPRPVPPEVTAAFATGPSPAAPTTAAPARAEADDEPSRLTLQSPTPENPGRRLALDLYLPAGTGPHPVVLLLPAARSSYRVEAGFARDFAARGHACLILRRERSAASANVIDTIDARLRQAVIDGRRSVDLIAAHPALDGDRVGLFGISLGGIEGALLAALEPRIGAAVIGLAGGDLPAVLMRTTDPSFARQRAEWLAATGLEPPAAEALLRRSLANDPLAYAPYADPARILMIIARFDRAVPADAGWRLHAALGEPETLVLPTGHYTAALAIPWLRPAVLEFIAARTGGPPATVPPASPRRTAAPAASP
jgi:2,6-dihydroxypseudooxynicotine hydrolase